MGNGHFASVQTGRGGTVLSAGCEARIARYPAVVAATASAPTMANATGLLIARSFRPRRFRGLFLRQKRPRLGDLRPDRISVLGESDSGPVVLLGLGHIAIFFRRLCGAKRGAQAMRLLLERRLEGRE